MKMMQKQSFTEIFIKQVVARILFKNEELHHFALCIFSFKQVTRFKVIIQLHAK